MFSFNGQVVWVDGDSWNCRHANTLLRHQTSTSGPKPGSYISDETILEVSIYVFRKYLRVYK